MIDVAFCVHVSDSQNVNAMKTFLKSVVRRFAIDVYTEGKTKMVRFAVVNYPTTSQANIIYFNEYNSYTEGWNLIDQMQFTTGSAGSVSECFETLESSIFAGGNGNRFYATNRTIIITDNELSASQSSISDYVQRFNQNSHMAFSAMQIGNTAGSGQNCQVLEYIVQSSDQLTTQQSCSEINSYDWASLNDVSNVNWAIEQVCPNVKDGDYYYSF